MNFCFREEENIINIALEQFKNINNGMIITVYADKNNGMYYAMSDDATYFTRHYEKKEDLYDRLGRDDFQRWNEKEKIRAIEIYNNSIKI